MEMMDYGLVELYFIIFIFILFKFWFLILAQTKLAIIDFGRFDEGNDELAPQF